MTGATMAPPPPAGAETEDEGLGIPKELQAFADPEGNVPDELENAPKEALENLEKQRKQDNPGAGEGVIKVAAGTRDCGDGAVCWEEGLVGSRFAI